LSFLVVFTTIAGFVLASQNSFDGWLLLWTALGTTVQRWEQTLHQWWESRRDACMERTRNRPLPSGSISRHHAFLWSVAVSLAGVGLLGWQVNELTAMLAAANILLSSFLYTPMKPLSPFLYVGRRALRCDSPVMGWTAVRGRDGLWCVIAGCHLFIWQIPHFLALAWLYREDYERGGFRMLPIVDRQGRMTCQVILIYSLALLPLGLAYSPGGLAGMFFTIGSMVIGLGFAVCCFRLYRERTQANARLAFIASILYLPAFLGLLMIDRASMR
jgi:protoheme IX farnesyltransferase